MIKIWQRVLILAAVFLVGIGGIVLYNGRKEEETPVYTVMAEAVLPVLSVNFSGSEINPIYGYTTVMDYAALEDSVTPVAANHMLELNVKPYSQVITSMSYELRALEDKHLVQKGRLSGWEEQKDDFSLTVDLGELMTTGEEYELILTVKTKELSAVYYYIHLYYGQDEDAFRTLLDFAGNFSAATFNKAEAGNLSYYMETNGTADTTSLGHTTIHSNRNLLTWGDLAPTRSGSVQTTVKRTSSDQLSVRFDYQITASGEDGAEDTFDVQEFLCVRLSYGTIYLMSYDRTVNQVFDPSSDIHNASVDLGIRSSSDFPVASSGNYLVFESDGELWEYGTEENEALRLFSFKKEEESDLRYDRNQHGFRIVQVEDNGDVTFLVYGYMNRGAEEGQSGIAFYTYQHETNNLTEVLFISFSRSFEEMEKDLSELFCYGKDGQIYLIQGETLYAVDLIGQEPVTIFDGLTTGTYAVNEAQTAIAWEEDVSSVGAAHICIFYLNEGRSQRIDAPEGSSLQIFGFMEDDCIYGLVREEDTAPDTSFQVRCPAYALEIADTAGTVQKHYEVSGIWISGITIDSGSIRLQRESRAEDGSYQTASSDALILTEKLQQEDTVLSSSTDDRRMKYYQVSLNGSQGSEKISVFAPGQISTDGRSVIWLPEQEDEEEIYYGYACGKVLYSGTSLTDAVNAVYSDCGFVVTGNGRISWERTRLPDTASVSLVKQELAENFGGTFTAGLTMLLENCGLSLKEEVSSMHGIPKLLADSGASQVLNLEGAQIKQILYYIAEGIPVLMVCDGTADIITGYDSHNLTVYDSESGSFYQIGRDEAQSRIEKEGSLLIACR